MFLKSVLQICSTNNIRTSCNATKFWVTMIMIEDSSFINMALAVYARDENFSKNIIFNDEACFFINGEVNKQNFRYWSEQNPHWVENVNTQATMKVNVWCAIWDNKIIGSFFFDNTVTAESYLNILSTHFWPLVQEVVTANTFMQHDGAPAHFAYAVRD